MRATARMTARRRSPPMGNYSLTNVFNKEPVVIAGALRSILWVAVLMGVVFLDEKQLAGIAIGLEVLLGLFTRQQTTPTAAPTLPLGTPVTVSGTDGPPPDGVVADTSKVSP